MILDQQEKDFLNGLDLAWYGYIEYLFIIPVLWKFFHDTSKSLLKNIRRKWYYRRTSLKCSEENIQSDN